ncbi:hypothetical protein DB30_04582 [Enhygromyxa salina]|uniref:Uncharacterized protein n=1 Tax=Enhygromyxa salina TaxID=215803 RepID=A0A0C2DHE0_9BACT|nr:hypothetical protein [Enhygromyxa salina]KIG19117.1 hypothetical protein DB30_04582 [Enhygromyxa salina]
MTELDPRIHASIGRSLRHGSHSPPPGAEDRMLAQFHAGLGGPPDGGTGGADAGAGPSLAASGQVVHAIKIVVAVVGLTAAGLGGVAVVGKAVQGGRAAEVPAITAPADPQPPRSAAGFVGGDQLAGPPADTAADAESGSPTEPGARPGSSSGPVSAKAPAVALPPTDASSNLSLPPDNPGPALAAELKLIRAARSARDPARALELLDQHATQFPNGELGSEREGLRVIALCQLERDADAQHAGAQFMVRSPGALLIQRVQAACGNKISLPTTEPKPAGNR